MDQPNPTTFPYQDASLAPEQRVSDLMSRMTLEDKVGQLFHQGISVGDLNVAGWFGLPSVRSMIVKRRMTHFNVFVAAGTREFAEWHNAMQDLAAEHPLRIPVTLSTDPRHSFSDNPGAAIFAGPFSQWPEPIGLAAIGDPELVERFADIARQEYLAVGLRCALHPQIDLATEPRWARANGTFGESAELTSTLVGAYLRGFQGPEIGPESVTTITKHFPGGGPQWKGEDAHFDYGREQVYPGGEFELHLKPFITAIADGARQMMPYYGMPVGTEYEEVGFAFNKQVLTGLLRERLGFEGIICTDWGVLSRTFWGVEELTVEERMLKAIDAGVDQFGGEQCTDVMVGLVRAGKITEDRIDQSLRRILTEKFLLGLFEKPYVDVEHAIVTVGREDFRKEGLAAQRAAHTLLTNGADGQPTLPLAPGLKVYAEGVPPEAFGDRAILVDSPADADVAVVRTHAPFEQRGTEGELESYFHAGTLDFSEAERTHLLELCALVPTVIDIYLDRPAILTDIADKAAAVVANFGASAEAFLDVLFGTDEPRGSLPFELPRSMAAVEASREDVPFDTADPLFRYGHGLRYAKS